MPTTCFLCSSFSFILYPLSAFHLCVITSPTITQLYSIKVASKSLRIIRPRLGYQEGYSQPLQLSPPLGAALPHIMHPGPQNHPIFTHLQEAVVHPVLHPQPCVRKETESLFFHILRRTPLNLQRVILCLQTKPVHWKDCHEIVASSQ